MLDLVEAIQPAAVAAVAAAESATGDKGMRPRPFLVEGLVKSVPTLKRIYDG